MNPHSRPGMIVLTGRIERSFGLTHATVIGGEVASSMATGPWLAGPMGRAGGGALGVLVDDVLGFAIVTDRPAGMWSVSAEISLDLYGPVPVDGTRLEAKGRPTYAGPHGGSASGSVRDAGGRLVAECRQHGRWVTTGPEHGSGPVEPPAAGRPDPVDLSALLGAKVHPTEGGAVLDLAVTADVVNPLGNLHGGVTLAACDLVAQTALAAAGGPAETASVHVSYPRPIPLGATPRFEGRIAHRGKGLGVVTITATIDGVKPVAIATVTTGRPAPLAG
ncbi:MAG TPA: PaaI family thioesterase [Trebonia sp.]|nr:PaaI family thioesterase [Trebonia sp.]